MSYAVRVLWGMAKFSEKQKLRNINFGTTTSDNDGEIQVSWSDLISSAEDEFETLTYK